MALNDIQSWRSPTNGEERLAFPVIANATFNRGEPLRLSGGGALTVNADNPAAIIGIAAHRATDAKGASFPAGTMCTVIGIPDTQIFRSDNFRVAGVAAVPTQANAIQELAGLGLTGGTWFIDTGMANLIVRIVGVLDANRNSIDHPTTLTGAGQTVLFKFI